MSFDFMQPILIKKDHLTLSSPPSNLLDKEWTRIFKNEMTIKYMSFAKQVGEWEDEDSKQRTDMKLKDQKDKKRIAFDIFYDGKLAGSVTLKNLVTKENLKYGELETIIDYNYSSKKIGITAAEMCIDFGFKVLELDIIESKNDDDNPKAYAIQKLGFTLDRIEMFRTKDLMVFQKKRPKF